MGYTIDLLKSLTIFFEDITGLAGEYDRTLDDIFTDIITLGSEIVEWEVSNIEKVKEK